jgi:hypothetical protein
MSEWDPIHVKNSPEAAAEYDGYRDTIMQLLRSGTPAQRLAEHLAEVEQTRMGVTTTSEQLLPVAEQLVRWYPKSIARWEAGARNRLSAVRWSATV